MRRYLVHTLLDPEPPIAGGGGGGGGAIAEPPSSGDKFDSMFTDLDAGEPAPTPPATPPAGGAPPAAAPAATPPKPAATPPAKPAAQPAKPAAAAKPGEKPAAQPPVEFEDVEGIQVPKFKTDKEFRGWGLGGYKKAKQLETDLATLQAKAAELERKVPQTEQERTTLSTRLTELEKRLNEKEQEIKYFSYQKSEEYKAKYEAPYQNAVKAAYADMKELTVLEPDRTQPVGEDGQHPMRERPATESDFDRIYSLPLGEATKLANKMFGHAASIVLQHRNSIRGLAQAAVRATEEWKGKAADREKEQETKASRERDFKNEAWQRVNSDMASKYPEMFAPDPNNKEETDALAKGFQMADAFFSDRTNTPLEQQIVFDAQIRNRIAGFMRLDVRAKRLQAELEAANKVIAELRDGDPGKPAGGGGEAPSGESEGATAEFDKRL